MRNRSKLAIFLFLFAVLAVVFLGEFVVFQVFKEAGVITGIYLKFFLWKLVVFPILFILTSIFGSKRFSESQSFIYSISALFIGLIAYLLGGSLLLTILILINAYIILIPLQLLGIIIVAIAALLTLYGFINASNPRVVIWKVKSSSLKGLWGDKKIILISDTHFGQVRIQRFAQKIVNIINKESPDVVFHTGDIIDGPSIPYQETFKPLLSLNPPLGNLYVEGNHERYSQEYEKFRSFFPKSFTDMTDKKIIVNGTQIIGLSFRGSETKDQTKARLQALGYDENIPSIILLHDPKNSRALAEIGVSMVLSGHTHGGQFFPITLLIRSMYGALAHGITYTKDTASLTTYGVGTAIAPMRLGTIPEIVIIQIV